MAGGISAPSRALRIAPARFDETKAPIACKCAFSILGSLLFYLTISVESVNCLSRERKAIARVFLLICPPKFAEGKMPSPPVFKTLSSSETSLMPGKHRMRARNERHEQSAGRCDRGGGGGVDSATRRSSSSSGAFERQTTRSTTPTPKPPSKSPLLVDQSQACRSSTRPCHARATSARDPTSSTATSSLASCRAFSSRRRRPPPRRRPRTLPPPLW